MTQVQTQQQGKFSIFWFSLQAIGQYALLLVACRLLLPGPCSRQFAAGGLALLLSFLGMHLFVCFFEWGFHRYVLHSITTPWLMVFARGHRNHHGLTPIRLQPVSAGSDPYVLHPYPIMHDTQSEHPPFPPSTLLA